MAYTYHGKAPADMTREELETALERTTRAAEGYRDAFNIPQWEAERNILSGHLQSSAWTGAEAALEEAGIDLDAFGHPKVRKLLDKLMAEREAAEAEAAKQGK